jgi:hypothetical protein
VSVTPSQIDRARGCLRMVGWDIADPQPYVQRPEAALGDEVHDGLESYNKAGISPETNPALSPLARELALLALPYAPRPKSGRSEGWFNWTYGGIEFSGRVDWEGDAADLHTNGMNGPATVDYKTSKDPTYGVWGTEAHLQDTQSLLYAKRRLELSPAYAAVLNRWLYIRTPEKKPAQAMPSDAIMERAAVNEAFDRLVMPVARVVDAMKKQGPRLNVLALPPNPMHCTRYVKRDGSGACPNIARCAIDEATALRFATGEETYDMTESTLAPLLTLLNGPGAPAPSAPAAPAVAPVNPFNAAPAATTAPVLSAAPAAASAFGGLTLAPAPSGPASLSAPPTTVMHGPMAGMTAAVPVPDTARLTAAKPSQEAIPMVAATSPLRAEPANVVGAAEYIATEEGKTPIGCADDAELGRALRVLMAAWKAA